MLGRKTLKSERARMQHIDSVFESAGQIMLVAYALFLFTSWLSVRPSFAIESVAVVGARAVASESVSSIAEEALHTQVLYRINRNNKLLYPSNEVIAKIKSTYPRIADVSVEFETRKRLRVVVTEHLPAILYCMHQNEVNPVAEDERTEIATSTNESEFSDCYFANDHGYVFADAPTYAGYPFVAIVASSIGGEEGNTPLGTYVLDVTKYKSIQTLITLLSEVGLRTHSVELLTENDVRISTGEPWDILLTTTKDPLETIKNLKLVLETLKSKMEENEQMDFIDLRFGNKIFYK